MEGTDRIEPEDDLVEQLRREVGALREEVALLRETGSRPTTTPPTTAPRSETSTRRDLMRLAGAAGVGAIAGTLSAATPVSAADVAIGALNNAGATTTVSGTFGGPILALVNSGASSRGLTATASAGGIGTVRADNLAAGGFALTGRAPTGADFLAFGSGIYAMNSHPNADATQHRIGDIYHVDGTVYGTVVGGTPGTRRVLAAPDSAGSLFPIEPFRAYDSRRPEPAPGALVAGDSRLISIADARSSTGAVVTANSVPAGATAIAYNLTITQTTVAGHLNITPGGSPAGTASIINWSSGSVTIANAGVVKVNAERQVSIHCAGAAGCSTHVVLDVVGYYR